MGEGGPFFNVATERNDMGQERRQAGDKLITATERGPEKTNLILHTRRGLRVTEIGGFAGSSGPNLLPCQLPQAKDAGDAALIRPGSTVHLSVQAE